MIVYENNKQLHTFQKSCIAKVCSIANGLAICMESSMKEYYQKEQNDIHAPKELIAHTKQKMRQAGSEKPGIYNRIPPKLGPLVVVAAAAVLCLLIYPLFLGISKPSEAQRNTSPSIYLGYTAQEGLYMEKAILLPPEFAKAAVEEMEAEGIRLKVTTDKTGCYMAAFIHEDAYMVISSDIKNKEEFVKSVKEYLRGDK